MDSKFRTLYNPHPARQFGTKPEGDSLTQQQFKEECDVNNILSKYRRTGMVSHLAKHQGNFGDFSSVEEYQVSLDKLMTAQRSFEALPSEIRSKFENDPAKLIEFLDNKNNDQEAIKLGLKIEIKKPDSIQTSMEKALASNDEKRQKNVKKD